MCHCDKRFYGKDCGLILAPKANGVQVMEFKKYLSCASNCVHGSCTDNRVRKTVFPDGFADLHSASAIMDGRGKAVQISAALLIALAMDTAVKEDVFVTSGGLELVARKW